jgi:hypothetical protein
MAATGKDVQTAGAMLRVLRGARLHSWTPWLDLATSMEHLLHREIAQADFDAGYIEARKAIVGTGYVIEVGQDRGREMFRLFKIGGEAERVRDVDLFEEAALGEAEGVAEETDG